MPQEHEQTQELPEFMRPRRSAVQRLNPETNEYEWIFELEERHEETPTNAGPLVWLGEDLPAVPPAAGPRE